MKSYEYLEINVSTTGIIRDAGLVFESHGKFIITKSHLDAVPRGCSGVLPIKKENNVTN